ncbi:TetR/AcrR family transcriptional regulator [Methanoregula sp.]|uniref:TetR/AcrR family transcriptional regulator n=1 Tax=Methanoregula sp. TaxID=2052170 RepID=UPI00356338B1
MPRINAEYREDARKKIIAAALDVAASEGWGALTLDALAKKVGVTKSAFYAYFTSSGSLMQDVIVELIRIIRNHILEPWQDENDIHEVLDRAADFIFLQPKPFIPIFIQAMAGLPEDPVFRKKIDSLLEENSALIETAIARFQKSGQIPGDVDLDEAVRAIYALTIGLGMMTHILGKDPEKGRMAWIMATERILKIGPRT